MLILEVATGIVLAGLVWRYPIAAAVVVLGTFGLAGLVGGIWLIGLHTGLFANSTLAGLVGLYAVGMVGWMWVDGRRWR